MRVPLWLRRFLHVLGPSASARRLLALVLGRRLPHQRGTVRVEGLHRPVTIRRDRWGIPHIEALDDHDAWFGLGFCQGQDRAFQLELILRVARGTLSELVGPRALEVDRLARRVGFRHSAERQWPVLSENVQAILRAFVAGINQGRTAGLSRPPHEIAILRGELTPWTPEDVLAFVKLQSFALPSNWDLELARFQVLAQDGEAALRNLDPAMRGLEREFEVWRTFAPTWRASNSWVLSARRTATGRPIVANDPHLAPVLPSQWYLAHLSTPCWKVAGAVFAGSPGFAAGFNGHVAWGSTAALIDNADWFIEELDPTGRQVREATGWTLCAVRREVIRVRGGAEVVEDVRITPRGPIVSPAFSGRWPALSLRAVWLDPLPTEGFLTAVQARNIDEFRRCFSAWPCLPLNLVFADTRGAIGFQMVGNAPRRRENRGMVPHPGSDEAFAWDGWISYDEMPSAQDPPNGIYITANNAPAGHETGSPLGHDWMDPYRWQAIHEKLSPRHDWTVADCQRLQMDVDSLPWREVRDLVVATAEQHSDLHPTAQILRAWDGRMAQESRAAALFAVFVSRMIVRVAQAKAPRSYRWFLGQTAWNPGINLFYLKRIAPLIDLLQKQPSGWFAASWSDLIAEELRRAARICRRRSWGQLHRLRPKSLLFGETPFFRRAFSLGPVPIAGDTDTIHQASVRPGNPLAETDNIPGLRMVVDVGAWSNSRFVICGGQSGNPCSPHFGDLFEIWRKGEGVPMAWSPDEVRTACVAELHLQPTEGGHLVPPEPSKGQQETSQGVQAQHGQAPDDLG